MLGTLWTVAFLGPDRNRFFPMVKRQKKTPEISIFAPYINFAGDWSVAVILRSHMMAGSHCQAMKELGRGTRGWVTCLVGDGWRRKMFGAGGDFFDFSAGHILA